MNFDVKDVKRKSIHPILKKDNPPWFRSLKETRRRSGKF
jgi:hypothetical protein